MYDLYTGTVTLQRNNLDKLKFWSNIRSGYNTVLYDAKFLKKVSVDVFGAQCLQESSVFGMPAGNSNQRHLALDATKLNFVRGSSLIFI